MLQDIPNDVHDKIIQKLLSSTVTANNRNETASTIQKKQIERRIIEELAIWRPDQLRPA
jgi:replicative DNA helicase